MHFLNPAADPDLVEFLYGLPSSLINLGGRGKGLAWESARRSIGDRTAGVLGFADLDGFFAALVCAEGPRAHDVLGGLRRLSDLGIIDDSAFARELNGASPWRGIQLLPSVAGACVRGVAALA